MTSEEWRPVVGFEGAYVVSNLGQVRSLDRVVPHGYNIQRRIKGKLMSPHVHKEGYVHVNLRTGGKSYGRLVHRLVCIAFHPPENGRPCVNHRNGRKADNWATNLEWCTYTENAIHALNTGLRVPELEKRPKGEANHRAILTNAIVREMRQFHQSGLRISQIAALFNKSWCTTRNAIRGNTWAHLR